MAKKRVSKGERPYPVTVPEAGSKGEGTDLAISAPAAAIPHLIPRPDGRGALLSGGMPGNKGSRGRTPDAIREKLREIITEQAIPWAKDVLGADRTVACPKCGELLEPPAADGVCARISDTMYRVAVPAQQEVKVEGGMSLVHDTNT